MEPMKTTITIILLVLAMVAAYWFGMAVAPRHFGGNQANLASTSGAWLTPNPSAIIRPEGESEKTEKRKTTRIIATKAATINLWQRPEGDCYISIKAPGWDLIFIDVSGPVCTPAELTINPGGIGGFNIGEPTKARP